MKLRDVIGEMKTEMKRDFSSSHALKSPAHITVQMPFKMTAENEPQIVKALKEFAAGEKPFLVELDSFGAFAPRVIFIKVREHFNITGLHSRLKDVLLAQMGFPQDEIMTVVHPHITLATRDLSRDNFGQAWPKFEGREFAASFEVNSIFLLKHNGRNWDIFGEFTFGGAS